MCKGRFSKEEWLDTKFSKKGEQRYIGYNHRTRDGKLIAKKIEPLEKCLMEGGYLIDLKSCNRQGLPTKKGEDMRFYPPRDGRIPEFVVILEAPYWGRWPNFNCQSEANESYNFLGVRAALKLK